MKKILFTVVALSTLITQTGCFGSFSLVQKIHQFNDGVSENKIVKTLLFYVLNIIPVYSVSAFLDVVIFNLIEFWTGSNPIAMEEGQIEEQLMAVKGESYKVTATRNQLKFEKLVEGQLMDMGAMVYSEERKSWNFEKEGISEELIHFNGDNTIDFITQKGIQTFDISSIDCQTAGMLSDKNYYLNN